MSVTAAEKPSVRVPGTQRVKSAATRAALIAAGRERFGTVGYHGTGTHELVALATVTRGALYHHFGDKKDLFEAVFLQMDGELNRSARSAVASLFVDTWRQLLIAMETYLRLRAENREAQRILLLDRPCSRPGAGVTGSYGFTTGDGERAANHINMKDPKAAGLVR